VSSKLALALVLLVGCGARASYPLPAPARVSVAPTAPVGNAALADQQHDAACANSAEPSSVDTCAADSNCRLCHDGSACGTATSVATFRARGAECARPDVGNCESLMVRCCEGHCRYVAF
jgi:hypothetical protein